MKTDLLHSECLVCKRKEEQYDSSALLCREKDCLADADLRALERPNFISKLPVSKNELDLAALPPLDFRQHAQDMFAMTAVPGFQEAGQYSKEQEKILKGLLPFQDNLLGKQFHLRCGNPILLQSKKLGSELNNVDDAFILDFSAYGWSNTLKDPRSWAIINHALGEKLQHLALWTAGNAGYSLSKIAQAVNRFLPFRERLNVYSIYDSYNDSVERKITFEIEKHGGHIHTILSQGNIIPPAEIQEQIYNRHMIESDQIWCVTDGLEGVGNEMYKLIFLQVLSKLKPSHVFVPVGTGNLYIGAFRALKHLIDNKFLPGSTKLIGAVPFGNNVYNDILKNSKTLNPRLREGGSNLNLGQPLMPKLVGEYSPLRQCIKHSLEEPFVEMMQITERSQKHALNALSNEIYREDFKVSFEPSSLAGFSALLDSQNNGEHIGSALVINTGMGNISENEENFLKSGSGLRRIPA